MTEVNATPPVINEVTIGGEQFGVTIKSAAPLGEVVQHARSLYQEGPKKAPRTESGSNLGPEPAGLGFARPASSSMDGPVWPVR